LLAVVAGVVLLVTHQQAVVQVVYLLELRL
jgi:hypothetical protein